MLLLPLLYLFFAERALRSDLVTDLSGQSWNIKSTDGRISQDIFLPIDLRLSLGESTGTYLFRTQFQARTDLDQAIVVGRIGDSDIVRVNECEVGRTGFSEDGLKVRGWFWNQLRVYPIPTSCLKAGSNELEIFISKVGGPGVGVFGGPIGLGEKDRVLASAKKVEWLRTYPLLIYGFLLLGIGFYYLFVFLLVPDKRYNGIYAVTALALGIFAIFTSPLPFRYWENSAFLMRILSASATITGACFLCFVSQRFEARQTRIAKLAIFLIFLTFGVSLFCRTLKSVYLVYEIWHFLFLILLGVGYFRFLLQFKNYKDPDAWRYLMAFSVVMAAVAHDVVITFLGISNPYLIAYGFGFFFVAVALTLAKEYADAFLYVEAQVSDRTKDLAGAIEQLRSMDQMKQRFFANVSHDLKTPIAVAMGAIEDAKDQAGIALAPAKRSLNKLLGMIQTILDTVKAESGSLQLQWKLTPVTSTVAQWMQPFQTLGVRRGLNMELQTYGFQGLKVPMDPEKFQRVFDNLLSNALKFTDKGTVRVTLRTDASRMYLDVEDSGIGIPEEERGRVFKRYFQSTRTDLKQHGGSGIGLSFVKEMVELHNGEIWVEASEFGGSKFIVALPLSQDVEVMGEYQLVDDDDNRGEILKGSLDVTYPAERPKEAQEGFPKILCAEDNPEVAQIVVSALGAHFNVHFASNGEKALERLESEPFDGLVCDIVMPRMRGDELVPKIRSIAKLRDLPIIMLSSQGEEKVIVDLLGLGANDYVTKPFRREILLARVSSQIQAHRTSRWISKNEKVIELGFLAGGMAHQIRNGLNSLQNHLSYQQKTLHRFMDASMDPNDVDDLKLREKIARTENFVERALKRIERLTDSVRSYTSGSRKRTEIKLADSVDLAIALHEDRLTKTGVQVNHEGLEGKSFQGYSAFHEVFVNLIGNGIDACTGIGGGRIDISAIEHKDSLEIRVVDNGKGIPEDVLPNLCQPFFTTKDPDSGTGLGLYMVRDIVEAQHGGELEIHSDGEGKGATFIVRVPKVAPDTVRDSSVLIHNVSVG